MPKRYSAVRERIEAACRACGRDPAGIRLLAVSKTFDAASVHALAALGQQAFGENYLQEALAKQAALRALRPQESDAPLEWHFIGPIQSNKTRAIAEAFDWVHGIERARIAERIAAQRPAHCAPLNVCIQVNVSGEASKSGCAPDEVLTLARTIQALPALRLRGLMAIPAPTTDPATQHAAFAAVRRIGEQLRAAGMPIDTLSMGMSGDLEAAIAEGATLVRVGSALFGERPRRSEAETDAPG